MTADPCENILLAAALGYLRRGWSVIPVIGKRAIGRWKSFQERPADEATLRRMFGRSGVTGLAVITGKVSGGLAIRDFDDAGAYDFWARANASDAATMPTVRTARGVHIYGTLDAEIYSTFSDGELRADSRHYCLLPPSLHPEGTMYSWTVPLPEGRLRALPFSLTQQQQQTHADAADPADARKPSTSIAWWTSAIASTLPTGPGQRNRRIFELARRLKAKIPCATPTQLRSMLREWHRLALPAIRTKDFSETWSDFAVAWQRVKRPAGQSFATAAAAADADDAPAVVDRLGYDGNLRRLAALCWQLQQQWGDQPFPLSCEIAGEYLGVTTRHAGRLLAALRFDGVIKRTTKGSKQTGKASEYRFIDLGGTNQ